MLCARYWSYPLPSLWERVSVTVADTSSSLPDVVSSHLNASSSRCPSPVTAPFPRHFPVPSISSILHGSACTAGWEGDFQFLFSFGVRHIPWGCHGVPLPAHSALISSSIAAIVKYATEITYKQ